VAEGTLRRATFAAQRVAEALASGEWFEYAATSEEDMAGMGGATGAVAKARAAARRARGAVERAARDPFGEGSAARMEAAAKASRDFADAFEDLARRAELSGSAAPRALQEACASLEAEARSFARGMAQAVSVRLLWAAQEASESASLSGHKAADAETKLTRHEPDVAGLNHRR
jgi:hypothetical protein